MLNKDFKDWIDDRWDKFRRVNNGGIIGGALIGVLLWIFFDSPLWITAGIIVGFLYDRYNE